jgi:hypothetical protein
VQLQEKQKYANKLEPFNGRKARNCNAIKGGYEMETLLFLPEMLRSRRQLSSSLI